MFSYPVVFVDIETTGGSYRSSRVLEVAAIRFENGEVTKEFSTIVNPDTYVPQFITNLTGITEAEARQAPRFEEIADELLEVLDGAVFVAHNVQFDYSFLKMEFTRIGTRFAPKRLCTVRLSRALYAHERGHSLERLIARHEIPVLNRHRALDDARAIMYFAQLAFDEHGTELFAQAVTHQLKSQYVPPHLDAEAIHDIADEPGVYVFRDEHDQPLYIGKSITLRTRVLSHFQDVSARELKISQQVHRVETIVTGSELAALLLESRLVKELQPLHNRMLRRVSSYAMLVRQDSDGYASVGILQGTPELVGDISRIYGLYETRTKAKRRIDELTRTFGLCPKLMGLEKAKGACFSYRLGKCRGACIGEESPATYNRRFEWALERTRIEAWPYDGAISLPVNAAGERVVIDSWMIVDYIDAHGASLGRTFEPRFDVDEYKIIRRFVREHAAAIRPAGERAQPGE